MFNLNKPKFCRAGELAKPSKLETFKAAVRQPFQMRTR